MPLDDVAVVRYALPYTRRFQSGLMDASQTLSTRTMNEWRSLAITKPSAIGSFSTPDGSSIAARISRSGDMAHLTVRICPRSPASATITSRTTALGGAESVA